MLLEVVTRFPHGRQAVGAIKVELATKRKQIDAVDELAVRVKTMTQSSGDLASYSAFGTFWASLDAAMKIYLSKDYPELCQDSGPGNSYSASHSWPGFVWGPGLTRVPGILGPRQDCPGAAVRPR